jgi:serine protease
LALLRRERSLRFVVFLLMVSSREVDERSRRPGERPERRRVDARIARNPRRLRRRGTTLRFERVRARRRFLILVALAIVAVVAVACVPPKPAPTAPTTTTRPKPPPPPPPPPPPQPTTTTKPPIPAICGVTASSAGPAAAAAPDDANANPNRYTAVVKHAGRSKVLTREVNSPDDIAQFRADAAAQGEVLAFAPDGEVHALTETPTWGFTDAKFQAAWAESGSSDGTGIRVAVLDTGVLGSHEDLTGHFDATPGADFTVSTTTPTLGVTTDPNGHGTHVSGIVAATYNNSVGVVGGAPGVTLVPVRVLGSGGSGSYAAVAAGILWAADKTKGNASVISMSLGGGGTDPGVVAAVTTVEDLTNSNYTHPVITVAAGNSSCATPSFPASLSSTFAQVLAVSALCKPGTTSRCTTANPFPSDAWRLADFSSLARNGSGNGIAAPGVGIISTWNDGAYKSLDGTSMATPFVAAGAALVVAHCPSDTAAQVVARLEASATDLGPAGVDKLYGYGMLDADNAVKGC